VATSPIRRICTCAHHICCCARQLRTCVPSAQGHASRHPALPVSPSTLTRVVVSTLPTAAGKSRPSGCLNEADARCGRPVGLRTGHPRAVGALCLVHCARRGRGSLGACLSLGPSQRDVGNGVSGGLLHVEPPGLRMATGSACRGRLPTRGVRQ
jgi:hypothetical protein